MTEKLRSGHYSLMACKCERRERDSPKMRARKGQAGEGATGMEGLGAGVSCWEDAVGQEVCVAGRSPETPGGLYHIYQV